MWVLLTVLLICLKMLVGRISFNIKTFCKRPLPFDQNIYEGNQHQKPPAHYKFKLMCVNSAKQQSDNILALKTCWQTFCDVYERPQT